MSVSGAPVNRTKCVLVLESSAGTNDGSIVSIEARRAEERLRSGGKLLIMSVNMSYETLILPDTLCRKPRDMSRIGG
jgi:hypothetical protein